MLTKSRAHRWVGRWGERGDYLLLQRLTLLDLHSDPHSLQTRELHLQDLLPIEIISDMIEPGIESLLVFIGFLTHLVNDGLYLPEMERDSPSGIGGIVHREGDVFKGSWQGVASRKLGIFG